MLLMQITKTREPGDDSELARDTAAGNSGMKTTIGVGMAILGIWLLRTSIGASIAGFSW